MTAPRGWCGYCRRDVLINEDGTLRHHGGPYQQTYNGRRRTYRCDGAGHAPGTRPEGKR